MLLHFFQFFSVPVFTKKLFDLGSASPLQACPPPVENQGPGVPGPFPSICPTKPCPVPPPRWWTGIGRVPHNMRKAPGWLPATTQKAPASAAPGTSPARWRTPAGSRTPGTNRAMPPAWESFHTGPLQHRTRRLHPGIGTPGAGRAASTAMPPPPMVFYSILWEQLACGVLPRGYPCPS